MVGVDAGVDAHHVKMDLHNSLEKRIVKWVDILFPPQSNKFPKILLSNLIIGIIVTHMVLISPTTITVEIA